MVWPDSLEKTAHVWQPGSTVQVTGRLQVRGDDFSIACYDAKEFQMPSEEGVPARPNPVPGGEGTNGRRNGNPSAGGREAGMQGESAEVREPGLLIRVTETDDAESDRYLLRQAIRVMLEYTGNDKVYVEVHLPEGKAVLMEIPTVSTAACPELQQRLEDLLGKGCAEYQTWELSAAAD